MEPTDPGRLSTWKKYRPALCQGCFAACCQLPVEATAFDLERMGLLQPDEIRGSLKKAARRLIREGLIRSFRAASGLFILEQRPNGDCIFLDGQRRCRLYEQRPEVCRQFPHVGPRSGFCPHLKNPLKEG